MTVRERSLVGAEEKNPTECRLFQREQHRADFLQQQSTFACKTHTRKRLKLRFLPRNYTKNQAFCLPLPRRTGRADFPHPALLGNLRQGAIAEAGA